MRATPLVLALAALAVPLAALAMQAPGTQLGLGASSRDVLLLQQELNLAPDTKIALSGAGSPGQETTYFGGLTLAAVKRFQAKNGIPTTGYVGPITLAALGKLAATPPAPTNTVPATVSASSATPLPAALSTTTSPVDRYLATMREEGAAQGYGKTELDSIEAAIRAQLAATTTDFTAQFYAKEQEAYRKEHSAVNTAVRALAALLLPQTAQAAAGLPFGGYVAGVFPICTCSPWVQQVFIFLPNPTLTSNMTLDYIDGTEAFNWHNLPEPSIATLGFYTPAQSCFIIVPHHACALIPARGTIEPIVGSSLGPAI